MKNKYLFFEVGFRYADGSRPLEFKTMGEEELKALIDDIDLLDFLSVIMLPLSWETRS